MKSALHTWLCFQNWESQLLDEGIGEVVWAILGLMGL
jgi:hypothetical protein